MAQLKKEQGDDDVNNGFERVDPPKDITIPTDQVDRDSFLFWIERSKNKNIVCYEALKRNQCDEQYNDVEGYWLCIDPEFVKKNRKKGRMTDREGLNMIERKMAYGWNVTHPSKDCYELSLVSLPSMKLQIVTDSDGKPHAVAMINGHKCYLRRIYVMAKESWYGLPKVQYVEITGIQIDNGSIQKAKKQIA